MAFSYSNSVTTENIFYNGSVKNTAHYTLHMTLSEISTDSSANTSAIAYKIWMTTTDWAIENFQITATLEFSNISNITKTGTYALQYPGYPGSFPTSITLLEGTANVPHNSDGTLNASFKGFNTNSTSYGGYPQNMSLSGSGTLTAIPRGSSISVTPSQTMGKSYEFTITKSLSSFTHKIQYSFGSASGYVAGSSSATTSDAKVVWTPPTSLASESVVTGGNKSATITYTLSTYNGSTLVGTSTAKSTLYLPSADTLNDITASQTMGTSYQFTCTQHAANYTHKLNWTFIEEKGTVSTAFDTSVNFTPSTSLGAQIPSSNSGKIYYSITTYNGSTVVGTSSNKTAVLSIPENSAPTYSFTATMERNNDIGVYISGKSTVTWSCTSISPKYGATISSYSFTFAGVSSTKPSGTDVKLTGGSIDGTDYVPTMIITDSRGNSTKKELVARKVYTYAAPALVSTQAYRSDEDGNKQNNGTYISILINGKTDYPCGGRNTVAVSYRWRETSGTWIDDWTTITNNTRYIASGFSSDKSYQVELRVTDSAGGYKSAIRTVQTYIVSFNIKEGGRSAAFFGYAEKDGYLEINGKLSLEGHSTQVGHIMQATGYHETMNAQSVYDFVSLTIPAGSWIIKGDVLFRDNVVDPMINMGVGDVPTAESWYSYDKAGYYKSDHWCRHQVSTIAKFDTDTDVHFWCRPYVAHSARTYGYIQAIRIS